MAANTQRPKGRDDAISMLNEAIEVLNLAKEISSVTPAQAVFGSFSVLVTVIRDSVASDQDCVDLGLSCADICTALNQGMDEKRLNNLSQPVREATKEPTTTVVKTQKTQRKVTKHSQRNTVSRAFQSKSDKETIATWKSELNRILHVFNTELGTDTDTPGSDDVSKIR